jgi:hypothetical protein
VPYDPFEEDTESKAELVRPRPEWLKFYYFRFADSTKFMDSEQIGWYWRLLIYAASQGEPPGYLRNDEYELRQIAQVKDLSTEMTTILSKTEEGRLYLTKYKETQESRWKRILSKFQASKEIPNLIFNKTLLTTIQEAFLKQKRAIQAGRSTLRSKKVYKSKTKKDLTNNDVLNLEEDVLPLTTNLSILPETKDLTKIKSNLLEIKDLEANASAYAPAVASAYASNPSVDNIDTIENFPGKMEKNGNLSGSIPSILPQRNTLEADASAKANAYASARNAQFDISFSSSFNNTTYKKQDERIDKELTFEELSSIVQREQDEIELKRREAKRLLNAKPDKPKLLRKKSESLFDEDLFVMTEKMSAHLSVKYPEFVLGDWEWLIEKFKNVYHGKKYISWSRTFYNFVANQVAQYNYQPGNFNWRSQGERNGQNSTRSTSKPTYESAAERNDRLEREADEFIRRLQGVQDSSSRDNQENSEALPLTSDDIREP